MNKFMTSTVATLAAAAIALSGCASAPAPINAKPGTNTIGGAYLVGNFPGMPAIGDRPAVAADPWGPDQFQQVQFLDRKCHEGR